MSVVNMCYPFFYPVCHIKYKWHLFKTRNVRITCNDLQRMVKGEMSLLSYTP